MDREEETEREGQSVGDSWIVSSCCGFTSCRCINDQLETGKNLFCPCGGKGQWYHHCQTQSRLSQQDCSPIVPAVWGGQRQRSVEYLRPPGSIGKNNSCFGDEALLFSALVRIPPPPFIALQIPGPPPNCLSCQAYSFKRQMEKLCVDVSVWEWFCATPGDAKQPPIFSAVSI